MKTLMVVGAGFGQLPAILKAKEMGLRVIAIDKNPDAIGMCHADVSLAIDVLDREGAIQAAKQYNIDGVMTMQTDLPVPTIGAVVDALKLRGVGLQVAEDCSNKIKTRQVFKECGVQQPKFHIVSTYEETLRAVKELGIPCVVKSPDSSGSRGVTKVKSIEDVKPAYDEAKKYSRIDQLLVEEYIEGLEIGAQGFSVNGRCVKVLLHNDTVSKPPYMIPTGHSFPIDLPSEKVKAAEVGIAKAVDALGIQDGPSNIDLILDKNNDVKIIEIGARIGATCLPELVEYYSGIDWVKAAILSSLGEEPCLKQTKEMPAAAVIIEAPKDGILRRSKIPESVQQADGLLEIEITANPGDQVNVLRKGTDRIGKIVVTASSASLAEKKAEYLKSEILIEIDR